MFTGDDSTSVFIGLIDESGTVASGQPGRFRLKTYGTMGGIQLEGFLVELDGAGNILVSEGYPFAWDSGMLTGGGVSINKYAPDGAHLWSVPIHPPVTGNFDHPGYVLGLGADQPGNVYAAGMYRDTLYLPPDTLVQF